MRGLKFPVLVLLFIMPAAALGWLKEYSYDFPLSDNDSRNGARSQSVERIRLMAAEEAGTYIQGTTVLAGDKLEESITQIGAAIVGVAILHDELIMDGSGRQLLRVKARADVDESVLKGRIAALREDREKSQMVIKLAAENRALQMELENLQRQRAAATDVDRDRLAKLLQSEVVIEKQIRENRESTNGVFLLDPLISSAKQAAIERKSRTQKLVGEWNRMLESLSGSSVEIDIEKMELSEDGKTYNGIYWVSWKLPKVAAVDSISVVHPEFGIRYIPGEKIVSGEYLAYMIEHPLVARVFLGANEISRHYVARVVDKKFGFSKDGGEARFILNMRGPNSDWSFIDDSIYSRKEEMSEHIECELGKCTFTFPAAMIERGGQITARMEVVETKTRERGY